jgi:flagellar basal body-associated protein FliL
MHQALCNYLARQYAAFIEQVLMTSLIILAVILMIYLLMLSLTSVAAAIFLWPSTGQLEKEASTIDVFGREIVLQRETHILMLVFVMGLIGGCAYDLWRLADNVNELQSSAPKDYSFREAQAVWYIVRPLTGSLLSIISYGLIRSGLFVVTATAKTEDINVYGIAGLSGVAGFFAGATYDKLEAILK